MTHGNMRPILVVNPRSDPSFVDLAEAVAHEGVDGPIELQTRLRAVYPDVVVRERGLSGDSPAVWYVYRDGRWVPPEGT
jgi:hypothetical protein